MTDHTTLPHDPSSIRAARSFVSHALADAGVSPDTLSSAALVVSELATNAVTHTGGGFTVSVERYPGKVRLEVEDSGDGQPVLGSSRPDTVDGRGLVIVAALCTSWGVDRSGGHKTVWCELVTEMAAQA